MEIYSHRVKKLSNGDQSSVLVFLQRKSFRDVPEFFAYDERPMFILGIFLTTENHDQ